MVFLRFKMVCFRFHELRRGANQKVSRKFKNDIYMRALEYCNGIVLNEIACIDETCERNELQDFKIKHSNRCRI